MAKVKVIKDDFTTEVQYIAKQGDLFAHGKTRDEALEDVSNKFYSSLSFEEKKAEFISKFKKSDVHKVKMFYDWHGVLTGSCRYGRLDFAQSKGLSLEGNMTVLEFLELTKDSYNGEIIKGILSDIEGN